MKFPKKYDRCNQNNKTAFTTPVMISAVSLDYPFMMSIE